jgi:hypothetical protein
MGILRPAVDTTGEKATDKYDAQGGMRIIFLNFVILKAFFCANVGNTLLIYHIYGIKMPSICDWLLEILALSL